MDLDIELLALLKCKGDGGSSVTVEPLTVTENGTTTAPEGKAYSPVTVNVQPPLGYLTFGNTAFLSVNEPVWDGTMYISNDAEQWNAWDGTRFEPGDSHTIYLRGSGNTVISSSGHSFNFEAYDNNEGGVACTGNIENLLDAKTVAQGEHPQMANGCYSNLFSGCTNLATAPSLLATTLTSSCYNGMFNGCTSLTAAPDLPATTLTTQCYYHMFSGCTSLTVAPALPATTLAVNCYTQMFYGCNSLTTPPELPAVSLASGCYNGMFFKCTGLSTTPSLPATTLANQCYANMFNGCTSLTTLPALPATTLANTCYQSMFQGCTLIKLSETNTGEYTTPYRIPFQGTGTTAEDALLRMFDGTGGTFTGTPNRNKTYYTSNAIPELTKITANGVHNVAQYNYAEVDVPSPALNPLSVTANGTYTPPSGTGYGTVTVNVPGPNLVALTATDNDTTYDPADYNADGFSSVSVEIAVPQVYVAQKQVYDDTVVYEFGVSVTNCVIAPLQSEASQIGVGMDLNFQSPHAIDFIRSDSPVFDDGEFINNKRYIFYTDNVNANYYPSAIYAVRPN